LKIIEEYKIDQRSFIISKSNLFNTILYNFV